MDPLEAKFKALNDEVEEFEDFVANFTSQMDDIISGKALKDKNLDVDELLKSTEHLRKVGTEATAIAIPEAEAEKPKVDNLPKSNIEDVPAISRKPKITGVSGGKIDYSSWNNLEDDDEDAFVEKQPKISEPEQAEPKQETKPKSKEADKAPNKITLAIQEKLDKLRNDARHCFQAKDYKEAHKLYTTAIESCLCVPKEWIPPADKDDPFIFVHELMVPKSMPIDPLLYVNRSLVSFNLEDYESSLEDCNHALAIDPTCIKAYYRKSQVLKMMKRYEETIFALNKCIELLNANPENHKIISKTVVLEQLNCVQGLKVDEDIAKEEKETLMQDSSVIVLEQVLEVFVKFVHSEVPNMDQDVSNALVNILQTHKSMQHAFRLWGGYEKLLTKSTKPSLQLLRVLNASLQDHPENCREMTLYFENLLNALIQFGLQDPEIVVSFLELSTNHEVLPSLLVKPRPNQSKIQQAIIDTFTHDIDLGLTERLVVWMDGHLDYLFLSYNPMAKIVSRSLNLINTRKPNLEAKVIQFLFKLSLKQDSFVKDTIPDQRELILEISIWLKSHLETKNQDWINVAMSLLHNSFLLFKRPFELEIKQSNLVETLATAMKRKDYYVASVKLLARMVMYNTPAMIKPIHLLSWNECQKTLTSINSMKEKDHVSDWIQLLMVLVQREDMEQEFLAYGGSTALLNVFRTCLDNPVGLEIIIGNLGLVFAQLTNSESTRSQFIKEGLMQLCIDMLKKMDPKHKKVRKNLGVLCAKLCHDVKGLEIARQNNAIELLYSLGSDYYQY